MQKKCQFKNGYTFNRVINGCWQLSAEHCLQGHLDYDDAIRAFHELVEQGFLIKRQGKGTFVCMPRIQRKIDSLTKEIFSDDDMK